MTRVFITILLPLLVPTALYVSWAVMTGHLTPSEAESWRRLPWTWLLVAGAASSAALLLLTLAFGDSSTEGSYIPPRLENGEIVPGHIAPASPAK